MPEGWVIENAGDYSPTESEGSTLPDRGNALTQVYRSADGSAAIRVDIHTDPTAVGGFTPDANGNPDASTVEVHGQPALLTVDPKGLDMTMLMWGEGEHTTVTVMASGISQEQLARVRRQPATGRRGMERHGAPCRGFDLVSAVTRTRRWATAGPRGSSAIAALRI